jgi:hypothetical protein
MQKSILFFVLISLPLCVYLAIFVKVIRTQDLDESLLDEDETASLVSIERSVEFLGVKLYLHKIAAILGCISVAGIIVVTVILIFFESHSRFDRKATTSSGKMYYNEGESL